MGKRDETKKKVKFAAETPAGRRSTRIANTPEVKKANTRAAATPVVRKKNAKDAPSPLSAAKSATDDMDAATDDMDVDDEGSQGPLTPINEEEDSDSNDDRQDLAERLREGDSFTPDDTAEEIVVEPAPSSRNSTPDPEESRPNSPATDARAAKRLRSKSPNPSRKAPRTEDRSAPGGALNADNAAPGPLKHRTDDLKASDDPAPKSSKRPTADTKPKPSDDPATKSSTHKGADTKPKPSDDSVTKSSKQRTAQAKPKPSGSKPSKASDDPAPKSSKHLTADAKPKPSDDPATKSSKHKGADTKPKPSDDSVPKSSKHPTTEAKPKVSDPASKSSKRQATNVVTHPTKHPDMAPKVPRKQTKPKPRPEYVDISDDASNKDSDSSNMDTEEEILRVRLNILEKKRQRAKGGTKRKGKEKKRRSLSLSADSDSSNGKKRKKTKISKISKGEKPGSLKYYKAQGTEIGRFATLIKRLFFRVLCKEGWWPGIFERATKNDTAYTAALEVWRELKQVGPEAAPPIAKDDEGLGVMCNNFPAEMRGKIKTIAVSMVTSSYNLFDHPEGVTSVNHIASEVARLNQDYLFAKADADSPIGTHDAVFEIVQKAFFVPEHLVHTYELVAISPLSANVMAVAILALHCALAEWSSGIRDTKQFSDSIYRREHATVMSALATFRSKSPSQWGEMIARHDANRADATPTLPSANSWADDFNDDQ